MSPTRRQPPHRPPVGDPDRAAYTIALQLLSRRELSESQVRERLHRRELPEDAIDRAVARLRENGAIDDRRTALACARTEAKVRHRGPARVLRHLQAIGIESGIAHAAVREVFGEADEESVMEAALRRRLHGRLIADRDEAGRVYGYLVRQGFNPSTARAMVKRHHSVTGRQRTDHNDEP